MLLGRGSKLQDSVKGIWINELQKNLFKEKKKL